MLVAIACTANIAPALASPVPALVEPASTEHHVGKMIFAELVTPDIIAAKQFYGGMFGWTFRDIQTSGSPYAEAFLNGRQVAGLIQNEIPAGSPRQPAWLSFFAVRDADAAKAFALQQGAKLLSEPQNIPDRGREAILADPRGAVFAVLASSSGDPPDALALPGEWIWSALLTIDPNSDVTFYQRLFDYEISELPSDDGGQHLMLASGKYARASANSLPANRPNAQPHWLNYIRVEDTVKMTAKLVALGGRVLVEPKEDRHGGMVAVVHDPQGSPFGLYEWTDTDSKEVYP